MPIKRIDAVALPFAEKRYTPDLTQLAALYMRGGNVLADLSLRRGDTQARTASTLANLFTNFQETGRQKRAADTLLATRAAEREQDRSERASERSAATALHEKERADDQSVRKAERDEALTVGAVNATRPGVVSPTLFDQVKRLAPDMAARFQVQDGAPVLMRTPEQARQAETDAAVTARAAVDDKRAADALIENIRHNKAVEAAAAAKAASEGGDRTALTPRGVDMAALNYRKTGVMPPLGMGDKGTRQQIINRAAELSPADMKRIEETGADIAGAKQSYTADTSSLTSLQKSRDAIGAFENTAQKNIDVFLDTAGKVVDTGSPLANKLAREVSGSILGSKDVAAYETARRVAINEVAKITSNPGLAGQLSDTARKEVEEFNPQGATLAQTVAVMRLLRKEMGNRISSLDTEIATIKDRGKTKATDVPAGGGMIEAIDENGNIHHAPAGTPLPKGWKLK